MLVGLIINEFSGNMTTALNGNSKWSTFDASYYDDVFENKSEISENTYISVADENSALNQSNVSQ